MRAEWLRLKGPLTMLATTATLALNACGGGTHMAIAPAPVTLTPSPTPTPTPTPTPPPSNLPIPPSQIGLVSSKPFVVLGIGDTYSRNAANNAVPVSGPSEQNVQFGFDRGDYFITLPGIQQGMLAPPAYNGSAGQIASSSTSEVIDLVFGGPLSATVTLPVPGSHLSPYSYTSFATWNARSGTATNGDPIYTEGIFAYGIPTLASDMPLTGTASYAAQITANTAAGTNGDYPVSGDVSLMFDFGAGTLSGFMHPEIVDGFNGIFVDFGRYDFTQTVYSTGSTSFSGKFIVPGLPNADSAFDGAFTGPQAAELMARFKTPYLVNGTQGTLSGIWIGKKN